MNDAYTPPPKPPARRVTPMDDYPTRGKQPDAHISCASVLRGAATTFEARNAVYKDNYKMVAPMVRALFPKGVPPELVVADEWHLMELILIKLARFASTEMKHIDSIHDVIVYAAMIEKCLAEKCLAEPLENNDE